MDKMAVITSVRCVTATYGRYSNSLEAEMCSLRQTNNNSNFIVVLFFLLY